ncbi:hypothetical protein [Promicromonospora soli]
MSPEADATRLRTARRIEEEYDAYSERVYAQATGTVDPDPQHPFCLYRLIKAGGNIQHVVDAPDFADEVLDHMGRGYREEIASDEDGTRWVSRGPEAADYRAAARESAHIRSQLEARGLIPPRAQGQAGGFGITSPSSFSRTEPRPDPDLDPPPF